MAVDLCMCSPSNSALNNSTKRRQDLHSLDKLEEFFFQASLNFQLFSDRSVDFVNIEFLVVSKSKNTFYSAQMTVMIFFIGEKIVNC